MANTSVYITTTLPYVNADPHLGFALEIVQADSFARIKRLQGHDVFFNFGTDEHGLKIYRKARKEGKEPQNYVDEYARKFNSLKEALHLTYNSFIRTTDPHHIKAAQEIWKRCLENGFIEKGIYKAKYCVGCELEKQDSELVNGRCGVHPNLEIETIDEENYFFKFSKFEKKLLDLYKKYPDFVIPKHRLKEIANFVSSGLEDFSISRLKEKVPWGVPVPNDKKQVMFVWFDALTSYISALGWPDDEEKFKDFWGTRENPKALQLAGKDNLRQQAAMWQAMLLAAGLPTSRQIVIHGFITSNGQKMSKSLGNVIDPFEYTKKFGADAVRYFLLAKLHPFGDSDFSKKKFEDAYTADLANGLGNLVARVAKLCETDKLKGIIDYSNDLDNLTTSLEKGGYMDHLERFEFHLALEELWREIKALDGRMETDKPWALSGNERKDFLTSYANRLLSLGWKLQIFLPDTAEKILSQFSAQPIKTQPPLFPRLS